MHDSMPLFWIAWIVTVVVCVHAVLKASGDSREIYGLMPVACAMWLYIFGVMAFQAATGLTDYFPLQALELGQMVSLVCLLALILGWRYGLHKVKVAPPKTMMWRYEYQQVWRGGMALLLLGVFAFRSFGAIRNNDFMTTSAYWYMLGNLVYPGACLCMLALGRDRALRSKANMVLFASLLLVAVLPFILAARRGPFFVLIMVLLYTPALTGFWRPRLTSVLGVLFATGFVMLLMVLVRPFLNEGEGGKGGGWSAALGETSMEDTVTYRGATLADNEFAYHCAAVWTTYQLGLFQYGTGDLSLLLHWIPRGWWPDKPELGRGWMDRVENRIGGVMGWDMVVGGAITGTASSFHQYGYAFPLFWYLIGYSFARVFKRSYGGQDDRWIAIWIGLLASTHWLIAQSFHDAFVPACIYVLAPLVVFRFARRNPGEALYPMRGVCQSTGASQWI